MPGIEFGSFEAREVLLRDRLRRNGADPDSTGAEAPGLQRPEFYIAASWDSFGEDIEIEEEDEDGDWA